MKRKTRDCVRTALIDALVPRVVWELSQGVRRFLFLVAQAERERLEQLELWNAWSRVSSKHFERSEAVERLEHLERPDFRFERSEAVERLERLERASVLFGARHRLCLRATFSRRKNAL